MHEFYLRRLEKLLKKTCVDNIKQADFLENSNVLIIAPHFDDEVLSCYGAIKKHIKCHSEVDIVYVTDGSSSKNSGLDPEDLSKARKKEAKRGLKKLEGNCHSIYMDLKDGELKISIKEIEFLLSVLNIKKYDYVYCPHFSDTHNDHKETYKLLMSVLEKINYDMVIRYYEFWNPFKSPNIYIDITEEWDEKKEAMEAHRSQLLDLNYIELLKKLDSIRGIQVGCKYAEMYMEIMSTNIRKIV